MLVGVPDRSLYAPLVATVDNDGAPVRLAYVTPVILAPPPWKLFAYAFW